MNLPTTASEPLSNIGLARGIVISLMLLSGCCVFIPYSNKCSRDSKYAETTKTKKLL